MSIQTKCFNGKDQFVDVETDEVIKLKRILNKYDDVDQVMVIHIDVEWLELNVNSRFP